MPFRMNPYPEALSAGRCLVIVKVVTSCYFYEVTMSPTYGNEYSIMNVL